MYCPKCGKEVADDDLFCGKCGFDLEEKEEQQETGTLDYDENIDRDEVVGEVAVEFEKNSEIDDETFEEEMKLNKVARGCALFAPISVFVVALISTISPMINNFFMNILSRFIHFDFYVYGYVSNMIITEIVCIGIYIGIFALFTKKYRSKISIWLFLLAPGTAIFVEIISDILPVLGNISAVLQIPIWCLTTWIQMCISYYASKAAFLKILRKEE